MPPLPPGASPLSSSSAPLQVGGAPLYLTGEDALKLSVMNAAAGVTVKVSGRFLPADGGRPVPFTSFLVPATDRSLSTLVVPLAEGWLLNAQALVSGGSPMTGQTFAMLSLARGVTSVAEDLFTLAAGYVTARQRLSYPGSPVQNSVDGAGALRMINGTTPAAGAEVFETVPTGARWQLLYFKLQLATSAVVANRGVTLNFDDGTNFYFVATQGTTQAASSTTSLYWAHGFPNVVSANESNRLQGLPTNALLPAGHRIFTSTAFIDVADQFSSVRYVVREWMEGN